MKSDVIPRNLRRGERYRSADRKVIAEIGNVAKDDTWATISLYRFTLPEDNPRAEVASVDTRRYPLDDMGYPDFWDAMRFVPHRKA